MAAMMCPYCLQDKDPFRNVVENGISSPRCPNPECARVVPHGFIKEYGLYPPVVFSLVGLGGHGKTCFVAGLFYEFGRVGKVWEQFRYSPVDENTMTDVRARLEDLRRGELPLPSPVMFPDPAVVRVRGVPQVGNLQLFIYDNGGETFSDVMQLREKAWYLTRARVVVFLISLKPEDQENPGELTNLLEIYCEGLRQLDGNSKQQSLVIVVTKADELFAEDDDRGLARAIREALADEYPPADGFSVDWLERHSNDVETWLERVSGQHNFVRNARDAFHQVRYCAASALGSAPDGRVLTSEISPRGVLVPLLWLARMQLPQARVVPPGEGVGARSFCSIEEAIAWAPPGSVVALDAGEFRAAAPILIRKPLALVGAGPDRTRIVGESEGFVIRVQVAGAFEARGVAFEHRGAAWANVAQMEAAPLSIRSCAFLGGVSRREAAGHRGGIGLKLSGATEGVVSGCRIARNALAGVQLTDRARPSVRRNEVTDNKVSGVTYADDSGGALDGNVIARNGKAGVIVARRATPSLSENVCEANGVYGVSVLDQATPTLVKNRLTGQRVGLSFAGSAAGEARENQCIDNHDHGIWVQGEAAPALEANRAERNKKDGIRHEGSAGGAAFNNECVDNGGAGMAVAGAARLTLRGNRCLRNAGSGIEYRGNASGVASGNHCAENQKHGCDVADDAVPALVENECRANVGSGLVFRDRARGQAERNRCEQNQLFGIHIAGDAAPTLAENATSANAGGDFQNDREIILSPYSAPKPKMAWRPWGPPTGKDKS